MSEPDASGDKPPSMARQLRARACELLGCEPKNQRELIAVIRQAHKRNILRDKSLEMIEGVLQAADMKVRDVMIPRALMGVLQADTPPQDFLPTVIETAHSRFPVVDGDRDKVIGIVMAKDLLRLFNSKHPITLNDIMRPAMIVPESKRLYALLREFQNKRAHMAIVADEYGGTAGLVTIEDVLEQIVGEIEDEHDYDDDEYAILERSEHVSIVKAQVPIEDFNEAFHTHFSDDQFDTLAGLLLSKFGHMPTRGESIEFDGFRFHIMRADMRRIRLVKVIRLSGEADDANDNDKPGD